jgi:hypothetical protein
METLLKVFAEPYTFTYESAWGPALPMLLADLMIFCPLGPIGPTNFKNSESRLFQRKCGADLSFSTGAEMSWCRLSCTRVQGSPRFLCCPTVFFFRLARAVGRQRALYTENSGFVHATLPWHISTFRGYQILFSIRNPYINRFANHFSIRS